MATDDQDKTEAGAGEGDGGRASSARRGTRARGERDSGRGGATSDRDLEAALARMDPGRLAGLLASAQARTAGTSTTPKISRTLDQLDAEQANNVIAACEEAIDYYDKAARSGETVRDDQALAPIRDVAPEVEAAILTNSAYRRKPVRHSVEVTRQYLESRHGEDATDDRPAA